MIEYLGVAVRSYEQHYGVQITFHFKIKRK